VTEIGRSCFNLDRNCREGGFRSAQPLDCIPEPIAFFTAKREEGAAGKFESVVDFTGQQRKGGFAGFVLGTDDDKVSFVIALCFQPGRQAAAAVPAVELLTDYVLQLHTAGCLEHFGAAARKKRRELDRCFWFIITHQLAQALSTGFQWLVSHILAVDLQEVESHEDEATRFALDGATQCRKIRTPVCVLIMSRRVWRCWRPAASRQPQRNDRSGSSHGHCG
jgi:hypothetical protein